MNEFLSALYRFIEEVEAMPRFKGKTQALNALQRIRNLRCFTRDRKSPS